MNGLHLSWVTPVPPKEPKPTTTRPIKSKESQKVPGVSSQVKTKTIAIQTAPTPPRSKLRKAPLVTSSNPHSTQNPNPVLPRVPTMVTKKKTKQGKEMKKKWAIKLFETDSNRVQVVPTVAPAAEPRYIVTLGRDGTRSVVRQ
jgi:hypothetical protein